MQWNYAVWTPVERIQEICDPLNNPPWNAPVNKKMISEALDAKRYVFKYDYELEDHAARIAAFIMRFPSDPIYIDVGVPFLRCYVDWVVTDGNHRLAAAIFDKRKFIKAIISGDCEHIKYLFGNGLRRVKPRKKDLKCKLNPKPPFSSTVSR